MTLVAPAGHSHGSWVNEVVSDPKLAISAIGLFVAITAGLVGWRSLRTSRSSLNLSKAQDLRKQPGLKIEYLKGICLIGPVYRDYLFELIIRNPADTANSISDAELLLDYEVEGKGLILKVRAARDGLPEDSEAAVMKLPVAIAANQSSVGAVKFRIANEVLAARSVERLRVELTDTFLNKLTVSTEMVQERIDEVPTEAAE
ncbi:hypothetical protein RKE38_05740 [Phycicoccus sp. M110.8]|uniref:hypothetical protein n=1 Tax=Phycicoccus sp. M110.8 TaxID=3075433 RepID=UPI0028FD81FE|nr:hypothetical protein [Phycicoccus sp. M110.8]MDU0313182.1 hypothetical protein [Phycicoccus sp. M110.8]